MVEGKLMDTKLSAFPNNWNLALIEGSEVSSPPIITECNEQPWKAYEPILLQAGKFKLPLKDVQPLKVLSPIYSILSMFIVLKFVQFWKTPLDP